MTGMMVALLCVMMGTGLLLSMYTTPLRPADAGLVPYTPPSASGGLVPSRGQGVAQGRQGPLLPGHPAHHEPAPGGLASQIRTVHAFSAGLLVAATLLHLLSLIIGRLWHRTGLRLSGLALLLAILGAAYTGSTLPWDALGQEGAQIGTGLLEHGVPLIGESLATIVRGGAYVGEATALRMRSFHTSWFPILILLLLFLHLAHLRRAPSTPASGWTKREPMIAGFTSIALLIAHATSGKGIDDVALQFGLILLPPIATWYAVGLVDDPTRDAQCDTVWRDLFCGLLTGAMIVTVATVATWERHPTAMAPEWSLYPPYLLLNVLSAEWAVVVMMAIVAAAALLPWTPRTTPGRVRRRSG